MATIRVELAQRGQVAIPKSLREQHKWDPVQQFSVLDLDGVVVMCPRESQIDALANQLRDGLLKDGATLEGVLTGLRASPTPREPGTCETVGSGPSPGQYNGNDGLTPGHD